MKKIIVSVALALTVFSLKSQVILTPEGLNSNEDPTKNYLVFEYDNINKNDLYKNVLLFIQKTYNSPKDVISEVPSESIAIRGFQPDAIGIPHKSKIDRKILGHYAFHYDIAYNFVVSFKDNKIRIDLPVFECSRPLNGGEISRLLLIGKNKFLSNDIFIYAEKDKELKQEEAKEQIENFFNVIFTSLKDYPIVKQRDDLEW